MMNNEQLEYKIDLLSSMVDDLDKRLTGLLGYVSLNVDRINKFETLEHHVADLQIKVDEMQGILGDKIFAALYK
mgnify:CR=1 FL=1